MFGFLMFLSLAAAIAFLVLADTFWGDDTWQWAADAWPGGAYGFAVFLGALVPIGVTLFGLSLARMDRKSWRAHKTRTFGRILLTVGCGTAMVQLVALVFNAQNTGKWGRGTSASPSWAFRNYPWLWAVGLASTLATAALLICLYVAYSRRRPGARDAATTASRAGAEG
ncbi:hypothetical protein ACIPC1_34905 [Streptomyces sp. NPDC087263]|uniref:hypothetical protein n=1 Tax=Streptomyces sp. NPDC087263 TaxID=3365773 RepID=UPI00382F6CA7